MKKNLLVLLLFAGIVTHAQTFQVVKLNGSVKMLSSKGNDWQQLKPKMILKDNEVISTDKSSSILIKSDEISFTLKESSAITISSIKKMSLDELILALAMENVMNTPRKKENVKSDNTGVYGDKVSEETITTLKSNDFGMKRLSGAKQLAENGMEESAIIAAKEVYRKYPETKKDAKSRIYFADLLFNNGLYEESYDDYTEIKLLELNSEQKIHVNAKQEQINKKLINK